jgi:hypothetical protein
MPDPLFDVSGVLLVSASPCIVLTITFQFCNITAQAYCVRFVHHFPRSAATHMHTITARSCITLLIFVLLHCYLYCCVLALVDV